MRKGRSRQDRREFLQGALDRGLLVTVPRDTQNVVAVEAGKGYVVFLRVGDDYTAGDENDFDEFAEEARQSVREAFRAAGAGNVEVVLFAGLEVQAVVSIKAEDGNETR